MDKLLQCDNFKIFVDHPLFDPHHYAIRQYRNNKQLMKIINFKENTFKIRRLNSGNFVTSAL